MATKRRKKGTKGSRQGKQLTPTQEEMVIQAYAVTGNKSQVAKELGMSWPTVHRVVKKAETNLELQKARVRALESVAGQVHGKTVEILDSISPEDIESGLIKKFDDEGQLVSAKGYGPSLMQKVTSAAILTDKLKVIEETKSAIMQDRGDDAGALPMPQDIESALRAIGDKVKRLRVMDVQFHDKAPEVAAKVQDAAHRASLNKDIEEASYEELDFDNPGD
jgi:hypothetical protein